MTRQTFQERMKAIKEKEKQGKALADHIIKTEVTKAPRSTRKKSHKEDGDRSKSTAPQKAGKRTTKSTFLLEEELSSELPLDELDDELEELESDDDKVECGNCHSLIPEDATVCPVCGVQFED